MLRRTVLMFHQAALGDFVLAWPVMMALAPSLAQARVVVITASEKGQLAERLVGVEWRDAEAWHTLFSKNPEPDERMQKLLQSSAYVLSFVSDGQDTFADNVNAICSEAHRVYVQPRPPAGYEKHVTDFHLEQLAAEPLLSEGGRQMVNHLRTNGIGKPSPQPGRVVIHPGAGASEKRWPVQHVLALCEALAADGKQPCVILGEVEREQFSKTQIEQLEQVADREDPADLLQLAAVLRSADCYVGNDTGPTHLAAVLGVNTVAVYASEKVTTWGPIGPRVSLVHAASVADVPLAEVRTAVEQSLKT